MKIKKERILPSLLCLLLAWTAASCREEVEMREEDKQGHIVTLNIDFGNKNTPKTPTTRAGVPDNQIDEIDVLTFIADPNEPDNIDKGIFHHRAQAELSTGADGKLRAKVRLFGNSDMHQHILVLANVRQRLNAMTLSYGMQAQNVTDPLHIYVGTDGKVDDSRPVPMAGILPRQVIDESYAASEKEVTMLRMFAKITVDPGAETIQELHLYNGRKAGRVIPYNYSYDKASKTVTQPPYNWEVLPGPVNYSPSTPGNNKIAFYMNETDSYSKAINLMNVTYLTVKATHRGGTEAASWYRIDLKEYPNGNFLNILRNHEYYIKLNENGQVQEPGGATEEDARQGLHKLNVKIMEWVYKGYNVQAPGNPTQKKLAVLETDLSIDGANESILNVYADGGGWYMSGLPSWAQVSQSSGGNGWANVRISSREANLTRTDRHATIRVHNGRASMEVQLHQPDACTLQPNGQPRQLTIRGQKYYVARLIPGGRCWMLDAYREPTNMYRPANGAWGPLYTPARDMPPVSDGWRIPNTADLRDFLDSPYTSLRNATPAGPNPILGRIYSSGRGFVENGTGNSYDRIYGNVDNTYCDANNVVIILVNGKREYVTMPYPYYKQIINGIKLPEIKDFNTWTDGAGVQQYSWSYVPRGNIGHTYLFTLPEVHTANKRAWETYRNYDEIRWQLTNLLGFSSYTEIGPLELMHNVDYLGLSIFSSGLEMLRAYQQPTPNGGGIAQAHMYRRGNSEIRYSLGTFPIGIPSLTYDGKTLDLVRRKGAASSLTEMGGSIRLVHD
ncbi:hypothetical protein [Bacteroides heparinolyticus]|uniref:hypothetical protein n=1 Tax=Prevotella heparinolytica TaxID=28113 RepID=UPI0023F1F2FF|nr:hypothetical protein [Bacteroides heparinolyticus]